jgi:hypothetical protein
MGPTKAPLIQTPRGKPNTNTIMDEDLYSVAASIGEDISVMRVGGAKYADHAHQHGIWAPEFDSSGPKVAFFDRFRRSGSSVFKGLASPPGILR